MHCFGTDFFIMLTLYNGDKFHQKANMILIFWVMVLYNLPFQQKSQNAMK